MQANFKLFYEQWQLKNYNVRGYFPIQQYI